MFDTWRVVAGLTLSAVAGAFIGPGAATAAAPSELAPMLAATGPAVPGSYIVVLNGAPGTAAAARSGSVATRATARGATVEHRYASALNGFSARLTGPQLDALRADPNVAYVVPNQRAVFNTVQNPPSWGLDRIDQHQRPLDNIYDYNRTGAGVTAYIIDTGIRTSHVEFGGRATGGFDAVHDGHGTDDCYGHGTHVAGTVGSGAYGVAKGVRLVAVRVGDCYAATDAATVIAGVDWVTANHSGPSVANMSLGFSTYPPIDTAVANSIAAGVTYVVSAGNANADACFQSPARLPQAITVGSADISDERTVWTNWGTCVDLFAPGTGITSAGIASDTASMVGSGTSMASPHVAGAAALFLETNPTATPAAVAAWVTDNATTGVLTNVGAGSPNRLLFANGPGTHAAMTWRVKEQRADGVVLVGSDDVTDPYHGDTAPGFFLPLLCLQVTGAAVPAGFTTDQYAGWSNGNLALTPPVLGAALSSLTEADRICATALGGGWRMAEFHDGWYTRAWPFPRPGIPPITARSGWNLWGYGNLPTTTRFWAYINDQPANAWS
jgi:subtilisin family serine protease